jgi:hypothetical protein
MITIIRMIRLWQLRTKWHLAFYQYIDKLAKNPQELEKKLLPYIAELAHNTAMVQRKESDKKDSE